MKLHLVPTFSHDWLVPDDLDRLEGMRPKFLISYHYCKDLRSKWDRFMAGLITELMIDSGAFSAFTLGAPIDLHAYAAWLRENIGVADTIASLDVVGDPEAGYQNAIVLRNQYRLDVVPTFHVGESYDWLHRYIDQGFTYIALGGMVPLAKHRAELRAWLDTTWAHIAKLDPMPKVHGFGMTNLNLMVAYPWHSVDSSSWTLCYRMGLMYVFDQAVGKMRSIFVNNKHEVIKNYDLISSYGFTPEQIYFMGRRKQGRHDMTLWSMLSWLRAERWINERKGEQDER